MHRYVAQTWPSLCCCSVCWFIRYSPGITSTKSDTSTTMRTPTGAFRRPGTSLPFHSFSDWSITCSICVLGFSSSLYCRPMCCLSASSTLASSWCPLLLFYSTTRSSPFQRNSWILSETYATLESLMSLVQSAELDECQLLADGDGGVRRNNEQWDVLGRLSAHQPVLWVFWSEQDVVPVRPQPIRLRHPVRCVYWSLHGVVWQVLSIAHSAL